MFSHVLLEVGISSHTVLTIFLIIILGLEFSIYKWWCIISNEL